MWATTPVGPIAAIEDTAAINSNYRRYLETLPTDLTEAEFIEEATSYAAYAALEGSSSLVTTQPHVSGKGQVAGLGGTIPEEWRTAQEAEDPVSEQDGKVEQGLETFRKADTILRGYDELWGMAPGTLSAQYAAEIAGGGYASTRSTDSSPTRE